MNRYEIRTAKDVAMIEARPYEQFMAHTSVFAALEAAAAAKPVQTALAFVTSEDLDVPASLTSYGALMDEIRQAANLFARLAGDEQPRVGLLLPAIPQTYFALWGAETAGVACPLNYLLNAEHLVHLVESARCNILVVLRPIPQIDLSEKVELLRRRCAGLRQILWVGEHARRLADDFDVLRAAEPADRLVRPHRAGRDEVVALFHTGGTTGAPKLAQHTQGNQLHSAWGAALMYGTQPQDRIVNGFPLFHVAGSLVFGLSTLLAGGTVILPTLLGMRNAGLMRRYWAFAAREQATLVTATPTGIATLMSAPVDGADLRQVRALLTGGAPLPTGLADSFERQLHIPVRNTLGMTECAGVISIEPAASPRVAGSCGLRLPFVRVEVEAIADEPGTSGILRLRGPNVSPGYTEPARDQGTFEGGWLISGDIARIGEGERIFITGRAKDVIIRNSHNIDPALIEDALMQHAEVALAAAVGQPDEYAGELPVAFVVSKPGCTVDAAALLRFVEALIAERPAMPKWIEVLPALPQTAVGKVYKPELRRKAIERVLRERLVTAGLADRVELRGEENAQGQSVCFIANAQDEPDLRRLMQPFSVAWRRESPP